MSAELDLREAGRLRAEGIALIERASRLRRDALSRMPLTVAPEVIRYIKHGGTMKDAATTCGIKYSTAHRRIKAWLRKYGYPHFGWPIELEPTAECVYLGDERCTHKPKEAA